MGEGAKRNIKCPCGSGNKYKDCHYGKSSFVHYEKNKQLKKLFNKTRPNKCIYNKNNDCSKLARSHSIQKKRILSAVAENGYVIGQSMNILENSSTMGLNIEKIGINQASTFSILCSYHDTILFKNIENNELDIDNKIHCFELALRTVLLEYSKVSHIINYFEKIINDPKNKGNRKIISNSLIEFRKHLILYDKLLIKFNNITSSKNYTELKHYGRIINVECNLALANLFSLQHDLEGNFINKNNKDEMLFLSVLPVKNKTLFVISHFKEAIEYHDVMNQIIKATDDELKDFINRVIAGYIENFFIKPSFWSSLDSSAKKLFKEFFPFRHACIPKKIAYFGSLQIDFFSVENTNKLITEWIKNYKSK